MALPGTQLISPGASNLMLSLNGSEVEQEDIGLLGELKVGESGWVSIGGTLGARASSRPTSCRAVCRRSGIPAASA
ncbi:hypothetical protein [Arenimonas daejeonensis]|uniref:hypothetical protein n=1 Tax=Arenimonas daejeonensis TaxID=370777 RepID=UPI0011BE5E3C|nr:hypothetical protein [Arenimonas daejeonensis]